MSGLLLPAILAKQALRFLSQRRYLQKQILQFRRRHAAACVGQFALKGKQMLNAAAVDLKAHGNLRLLRQIRCRGAAPLTSGCASARQLMVFFLHHVGIQPRQTRLLEEKEEISHAAKLSPQEQCATAFGLVTLNPPFCRSSL